MEKKKLRKHRKNETTSEEEASVFYEDNDIAFIFDTIESEIAYLQQMEANGEINLR